MKSSLNLAAASALALVVASQAFGQAQSTNPHQPGGPPEPSPGAPAIRTYPGAVAVPLPDGRIQGGATYRSDDLNVDVRGSVSPNGDVSGNIRATINPLEPTRPAEPPIETPKIGEPEPGPGYPGFPNGLDVPPDAPGSSSEPPPAVEPPAPAPEPEPSMEPMAPEAAPSEEGSSFDGGDSGVDFE
ncbi:hypothetical protein SAZ10_02550 [Mesorhizobium sp. BAC0120]|uniref:hypothetical protein n=1 Tax=Mesorhizobium sp. BAC0120 TaxID=3090670 RepID=UPI00298C1120|nr:hypothetical protein [Mesorhizobium sp. BAC0120]MDW6020637.1 hypothetical protein [Mesorhizobium sp. BAC0120]